MVVGIFRRRPGAVVIGAVTLVVVIVVVGSWMVTLRSELEFEGTSYERGESVHFALSVCSDRILPMRTDDGKPSWEITDESGNVVADSSHQVFTLELKTLSWAPRECRRVLSVQWDQRKWNQRPIEEGETGGVPRRGEPVQPGSYELEAGWGDLPHESATFEIVE